MTHQDDIAHLMTAEQGKPLAEAKVEVAYGASFVSGLPKRPSASTAKPCRSLPPTAV